MKIEVICPLYNGEKYILPLYDAISSQKTEDKVTIKFILTNTNDDSERVLKQNKISYKKIEKSEFSHSLTREEAAKESKADIIVFISQDIEITQDNWLENLVADIKSKKAAAAFSRQITKYNNIEKYTREKNYPNHSRIVDKNDLSKLGLNTFFFSDASSAIDRAVFKKLKYYDGKNLPINEDMYIAYKLIMNGYKIKYSSNSIVYHSHKFTLKQLYERYKLTGQFFSQNKYLDQYGTTSAGGGLAKYVLKNAIKEKNIKVLLRFIPDMGARYLGMKIGKMKGELKC